MGELGIGASLEGCEQLMRAELDDLQDSCYICDSDHKAKFKNIVVSMVVEVVGGEGKNWAYLPSI